MCQIVSEGVRKVLLRREDSIGTVLFGLGKVSDGFKKV